MTVVAEPRVPSSADSPSEGPSPETPPREAARWRFAGISSIPVWVVPVAVAFVLAFVGISDYSLWMDEAATVGMAKRSLVDVLRSIENQDILSGFYYVTLSLWVKIAGTSELALRAPSALGIVAAAGFTAEMGKRLFNARVGLVAGLLLAVTPRVTSLHARDARQYGLLLGVACASSLLIVVVTERASLRRWLAYGASVVFLGLLHVLALPLLVSHAVLVQRRGGWMGVRRWLLVAVPALVPAGLVLLYSRIQGGYPTWGDEPNVQRLLNTPAELLGDPRYGWFLLGLAVAALARTTERLFLGLWLFIPPLAIYVVSHLLNPSWIPRYFLLVTPALVLLAARSMTNTRLAAAVGVVFVFGLVWQPTVNLREMTSQWQDYRAAAAYVEDHEADGDAIVYDHPAHREGLEYYFERDQRPVDVLFDVPKEERARLYPSETYPITDVSLDDVERVWVIGAADRPLEIVAWLEAEGFEIVERTEVPGLPVILAQRS